MAKDRAAISASRRSWTRHDQEPKVSDSKSAADLIMTVFCILRSDGHNVAQRLGLEGGVILACALAVLLALATPLHAQQTPEAAPSVKVGLYLSPPFVMEEKGRHSGMAVELWQNLASSLNLDSDYQVFPTLGALIDAAVEGDVDIAVTNLTITQDRAQRIDFTQPWFDAGLRIMVNDDQSSGFWDVMAGLQSSGHLRAYAWLAFVIVIATVLLTLFDRRIDKDFPRRWRDGLAESFYAVMSIATSGKSPSRKNLFGWIGRIWQALWLVCGIAVLAYVTSSVTSVMTTLSLTNRINGLADLPGKTVGVFSGSVAEEYARASALGSRSFPNIDEAVAALRGNRIAAIVGDAPVLEYYAHTHPEAGLSVVGAMFEPDKYGFGLSRRSQLVRPLTVELLGAHESGLVEELRSRYFGDAP
jgi:polar amino acid transport system substrate-binding protein